MPMYEYHCEQCGKADLEQTFSGFSILSGAAVGSPQTGGGCCSSDEGSCCS
jgi:predicted nucleic acid-binding Zn ribbon protein